MTDHKSKTILSDKEYEDLKIRIETFIREISRQFGISENCAILKIERELRLKHLREHER